MTIGPRLRRAMAHLLVYTLLLQAGPAWSDVLVVRTTPRGWPQALDLAQRTGAWAGERSHGLRAALSGWLAETRERLAPAGGPAAARASAPPAQFPPEPPDPPNFRSAAAVPSGPRVLVAAAGDVPILPGWNLISLPARPVDPSPSSVFGSLGAALHRVYAYDACDAAAPWKVYDPADPAGSTLTAATERSGLWVEATSAAGLPTAGDPPLATTIHLCPGWNLIGFPAAQPRPVQNALVSIAGKYQRVIGYDAADTADPWEVYDVDVPAWASDLKELRPGRGYWILATVETDLTLTNQGNELSVDIAQPAQLAEVTAPTPVVGSAQGQALASWELRFREVGEEDWTTIGSGTAPVSGGVLGTFDPTLLLNGLYEIELSATDLSGGGVSLSDHVEVAGQQKIGNFTLSFSDLEVPLSGLPIQVIRTYDSREKHSRDFGYGWTLEVRQGSYRNNRTPGDGWRIVTGFVPCQSAQETKPHLTTIRLSDREIYRFRLRLTRPAITQGGCFAEAGFAFVDGPVPGATLESLGGTEVFYANADDEVVDAQSFEPYEPHAVRLTTRDGRVFDLNLTDGVTRLADANGNELRVTAAGITHSDGRGIPFTRDAQGRITDITDPLGHTIHYTYDTHGDLIAVTDRENQTTHFTYNATHGLLSIEDPRGIQPLRNEYDAEGRLLRTTDAFGKTIEFNHDLAAHREVVTDRLGHSKVLEYDARGNVVRATDALGKVTTWTFDAKDHVLSETNPLGETRRYTYDANQNLIQFEDPLRNQRRYTYNSRGQILTATDGRGKTTTNTYDEKGKLLSTADPLGNTWAYSYDGRGRKVSETDPEGAVTRFAYDGFGNVVQEIDALGTGTTLTYDDQGNVLTRVTARTAPSGAQTLTWRYAYDRSGRFLRTTDPDGKVTESVYDALGNVIESIDKLGLHTVYTLDEMGRLAKTRYPDDTTETSSYDAEGRRLTLTDRGGRTTSYSYDAMGRLLTTVAADGAVTAETYDAAGRPVTLTDPRGNVTSSTYDAAGRRIKTRDALAHEILFAYDASGNLISVTDPKGNKTTWERDDAGRIVSILNADGTSARIGYDRNGRRIAETDPAGVTTGFAYDALGRLVTITDALDHLTYYAYDERGNRVSQIDANGHESRFDYDDLGRLVKQTLPGGAAETFAYDAAGRRIRRTDFNGAVTTYTYDFQSRLLSRSYPDGSQVAFTYTPAGRRATATDARGTTSYSYDARDRLVSLSYPDGSSLSYTYDRAGNRTSLTAKIGPVTKTSSYTYDALDHLQTVSDPDGRIYTYSYDENGNRAALQYPSGVATSYAYDAMNRLTSLTATTSAGAVLQRLTYTLGPAGTRTRIDEEDGTRRSYTYDSLYRLTDETVTNGGDTVFHNGFVYDPVGNRLSQTRAQGTSPATTVESTYDERDRLLREDAATYTWDADGNQTGKSGPDGAAYSWDFEKRLIQVSLADGTVVRHSYDADGNRVRTETTPTGGTTISVDYLIDPEWRTSARWSGAIVSQVVAETQAAGLKTFYLRGDGLLAAIGPTAIRFFHPEAIGSVRALTDESQGITDRYSFEAFGTLVSHTGSDSNSYLFAGEPLDPASGLIDLRARWMAPGSGRFLSEDPLARTSTEARAEAAYTYASLDPLSNLDPTGQMTIVEEAGKGAAELMLALKAFLLSIAAVIAYECAADFVASTLIGGSTPDVGLGCHNGDQEVTVFRGLGGTAPSEFKRALDLDGLSTFEILHPNPRYKFVLPFLLKYRPPKIPDVTIAAVVAPPLEGTPATAKYTPDLGDPTVGLGHWSIRFGMDPEEIPDFLSKLAKAYKQKPGG